MCGSSEPKIMSAFTIYKGCAVWNILDFDMAILGCRALYSLILTLLHRDTGHDTDLMDCALPFWNLGHRNTWSWQYHTETQDTGLLNCDIAIVGHGILNYWILILLCWDKWHRNTRLWHCRIGKRGTEILDWYIPMLGFRTLNYWVVTLWYEDKRYSSTGLGHFHVGSWDNRILDCDIAILGERTLN